MCVLLYYIVQYCGLNGAAVCPYYLLCAATVNVYLSNIKDTLNFQFFFCVFQIPSAHPLYSVPTVHHTGFYTHYTRLALTRFYACHIIWYTLYIIQTYYSVHLMSVFLYIIIYVICILYRSSAVRRPLFCWLPIVLIRV